MMIGSINQSSLELVVAGKARASHIVKKHCQTRDETN